MMTQHSSTTQSTSEQKATVAEAGAGLGHTREDGDAVIAVTAEDAREHSIDLRFHELADGLQMLFGQHSGRVLTQQTHQKRLPSEHNE
jgi:hypothetical protein